MYMEPGSDYQDYLINLTPSGYGTTDLEILSWVDDTALLVKIFLKSQQGLSLN